VLLARLLLPSVLRRVTLSPALPDPSPSNVMWTFGCDIKRGRIEVQWHGLESNTLNERGDLVITTDFRREIVNVLDQKFRLNDKQLSLMFPEMKVRTRS
jgi:uncharacterized protein (DUF1501 family)